MNGIKCLLGRFLAWGVMSVLAWLPSEACGQRPVSVTSGELRLPPALSADRFVVSEPIEAVAVPLDGWKVEWPERDPGSLSDVASGIVVIETTDIVRGARLPVLRLELTKGSFTGKHPVIELAWPFNAETHNILSFVAKVEVPETLKPVIRDSTQVYYGWPSGAFNRYFDDFGIAPDDGNFQWAASGVPTTHFRSHDYPATRGPDGYTDFVWDMKYEDHTGNKGFIRDRVRALRFHYDTRKIPEGEKVAITIALPKLVKGAHVIFDEPDRYAEWTDYVANLKPDYSDSSEELLPPKTGRIDKPIRITENGKARAEIIVDLSERIRVDNFFPKEKMTLLLKESRGYEIPTARLAATELRRWIKTVTDAELPILLVPSKEKNAKIYLGAPYAKPYFADDLQKLASGGSHDGYAIRVKDGSIYIFGASPAGTMFGVYAFVENNTDLIWAMMNDPAGTVYTKRPTLDIIWADTVSKPALAWRGCFAGEWARQNSMNVGKPNEGGFGVYGGHYLCPQYYDHCEGLNKYNPVLDRETGVRPQGWTEYRQLACLSDPTFLEHALESVPNVKLLKYSGRNHCVFGVDDNYGVCECPECQRPFTTAEGRIISPDTDYLAFYNAWFYRYLNKLDDAIQKEYPGFTTSTYAYFFANPYPIIPLNKTIAPQLCTYIRKSQNEPVFAPANQHWWKIYRDWTAHNPDLTMYCYWGLGFVMRPMAEVMKFDVMAQRDIDFLSNYSEGNGATEYIGVADERWCMARLLWNPDLDVDQLHRRFNRRAYREAAPWMDKFRGVIRENFYKRANRSIDFEESRELAPMIRDLGIEKELRTYLDEARKAVRHPSSKVLVEKAIADFNHYMNGQYDWNWPSKEWDAVSGGATPLAKAAAEAWSKNHHVYTVDGHRELLRDLWHGRGFTIACPIAKPASTQVTFRFRVPAGGFSLADYPAVTLSDKDKVACAYAWKDNKDGTYDCTVRAPGGNVSGFAFAFPKQLPQWHGDVRVALVDIVFSECNPNAAKPAQQASPLMQSAEYKSLLAAIEKNDADALATLATSAASPSVRLLAANEAGRRGRDLAELLRPWFGKMGTLGVMWAHQLQPVIEQHLEAGDYPAALPWILEKLAHEGLSGRATEESGTLRDLATCLLKTGGTDEVVKLLEEKTVGLEADPEAAFQIYRSVIPAAAAAGKTEYAFGLLATAFADRRVDESIRWEFLIRRALPEIVKGAKNLPADRVFKVFRKYDGDDRGKALGWSLKAKTWSGVISNVAAGYADKDEPDAASALYQMWAKCDGAQTPIDYVVDRQGAEVRFFRGRIEHLNRDIERLTESLEKQPDNTDLTQKLAFGEARKHVLETVAARAVSRWYDSLEKCVTDGSTHTVRRNAEYTLMMEHWDSLNQNQKIKTIDDMVHDQFLASGSRQRAAEAILRLYTTGDSVNWTAIVDHAIRAVAAGDWSENRRNAYFCSGKADRRLDYLCELAKQMVAAGAKDEAKRLLERGAPILGYTADTMLDDEPAASEADMKARLDKLDAAMATCGAKRPPKSK